MEPHHRAHLLPGPAGSRRDRSAHHPPARTGTRAGAGAGRMPAWCPHRAAADRPGRGRPGAVVRPGRTVRTGPRHLVRARNRRRCARGRGDRRRPPATQATLVGARADKSRPLGGCCRRPAPARGHTSGGPARFRGGAGRQRSRERGVVRAHRHRGSPGDDLPRRRRVYYLTLAGRVCHAVPRSDLLRDLPLAPCGDALVVHREPPAPVLRRFLDDPGGHVAR